MSLVLLANPIATVTPTPPVTPTVDCHTIELAVAITVTLEVAADPCAT